MPASATATTTSTVNAAFTPRLTYVTCPVDEDLPPRTRCAKLTVPLDWQTPTDGRTVEIAMRVTRPRRDAGRLGLTWNPGGPGGEAVPAHGGIYSLLPATIRDRFDLISWDPRGVGKSQPKLQECTPVEVLPPATGPINWDAYWEEVAAKEGAAAAACFAANPNAAPYLGTWQVIRDMDAMRAALGYSAWNFWGMSYGTRLGSAYARTFPNKLRALIEDAALMSNESIARFGSTSAAGYYQPVPVYASLVGKGQAYKIRAIEAYLEDSEITIEETVVNRYVFQNALNANFRDQSTYPDLRIFIKTLYDYVAAKGADSGGKGSAPESDMSHPDSDGDNLVPDPESDSFVPDPYSDSFIIKFVNCADMADRPTPAVLARMSKTHEESYGAAYAWSSVGRSAICLGLPSGYSPPSPPADTTIVLPNPPLFLLAIGDAATPWVWGRSLANTFAGSSTVTSVTTAHGLISSPSACVQKAAEEYLLTPRLPRPDIFCPYVPSKHAGS
ncbi:MAG: alpha/beta fold hydrolase [Verrucomicrobia bacterium]|nr:alpha/beta fold hydrolase [Verrucomicrobiota bacterium]